ncbi:MAG: hypothetical protein KAZ17_00035 [Sphingorhabdus sp.]|nr:hypothetical protein [Sphingorhabdus sp.]
MNIIAALIWLQSPVAPVAAPPSPPPVASDVIPTAPELAKPPVETPDDEIFKLEPEATPKKASDAAIASQEMIDSALKKIKPDIKRDSNIWRVELGERMAIIITDPLAERMRIMVPIVEADTLDEPALRRVMQANFDSALDARYAIAQGVIWGTFIHPLTTLTEKDFLSGLAQTFKVADNFGTTYSSDVFVYGGGDSNAILGDVLEQLKALEDAGKVTA